MCNVSAFNRLSTFTLKITSAISSLYRDQRFVTSVTILFAESPLLSIVIQKRRYK